MKQLLKELCSLSAVSGRESEVRDYILEKIDGFCDATVDPMGNIIAFKKGKKRSSKKVMLDAHMDEVGLIIKGITDGGFLKFETVGGIDTAVLLSRPVKIGEINGVIASKPVHLIGKDEAKKLPKKDELYIDIGAESKLRAESVVSLGDTAVFVSEFEDLGDLVKAKAIDDRAGCAVLIELLKKDSEFDFWAVFSTAEEIGCRGAAAAAYTVAPDAAIVIEATTAADIEGVPDSEKVCRLGEGAVLSFMDRGTVYDENLYRLAFQTAKENAVKVQPKAAVAGGNNASKIHLTRGGIPTAALSVPCRYIHSPSSVADINDIYSVLSLAENMIGELCK